MTTYAREKREANGRKGVEISLSTDLLKRFDKFIRRNLKGRTRSEVVEGMIERVLKEMDS